MRDKKEELCIEKLESNMTLLGVTGVEDLLQNDIKSVIISLREAGIKLWMLTGDKLETAKCIAISTGFKNHNQRFFEINTVIKKEIERKLRLFENEFALVVTGKALEVIFSDNILKKFFFQ